MAIHPKPWSHEITEEYYEAFPNKVMNWLDQGYGSCVLKRGELSKIVAETLEFFDEERYRLACYVVMPNHVHVLFQLKTGWRMTKVLQSWKGFSARKVNKALGNTGAFWQAESWDTMIKSERHFFKVVSYIEENPNKAGLRKGEYKLKRFKRAGNTDLIKEIGTRASRRGN